MFKKNNRKFINRLFHSQTFECRQSYKQFQISYLLGIVFDFVLFHRWKHNFLRWPAKNLEILRHLVPTGDSDGTYGCDLVLVHNISFS